MANIIEMWMKHVATEPTAEPTEEVARRFGVSLALLQDAAREALSWGLLVPGAEGLTATLDGEKWLLALAR